MPYLPPDPPPRLKDLFVGERPNAAGLARWLPGRTTFFGTGRAALWGALRTLGIGAGDEVLLPAYLCESVVSPIVAVGARPTFYPIGRDLSPDLPGLEASIGARTRAVVAIHYLGFPAPVERLGILCAARGLDLIEDCAHALFSRRGERLLGSFGDAAIFSPWKSLPLPDGGILALNRRDLRADFRLPPTPTWAAALRLAYRSLGTLEVAAGWSPRTTLLRRPELRYDLHRRTSGAPVRIRAGSRIAYHLLRGTTAERVVARRREHFGRLLEATPHVGWARPIVEELPEGVCPLGLAVVVEDRDRMRDALLAEGVNVRTYWEHLPPEVDTERFTDVAWLRDRVLVLPVHQGLRRDQIDWLARRLPAVGARNGYGSLAHR